MITRTVIELWDCQIMGVVDQTQDGDIYLTLLQDGETAGEARSMQVIGREGLIRLREGLDRAIADFDEESRLAAGNSLDNPRQS